MRDEMWHIVSTEDGTALQWDEAVIEFDTYHDATLFFASLPIEIMEEVKIDKNIVHRGDNDYINMSGKILAYDDEGDVIIIPAPNYY